ncbi:ROK family protein [Arthrobacter sp. A5]|uniref:ROK family protein n=1 Tax=Arthrobacter sp. A5 TaxID=576926 RepID=UPI003DA8B133
MSHAQPAVLAFDVGGTDMKAGIVAGGVSAGNAVVRDLQRLPTPHCEGTARAGAGRGDAIVERIAGLTETYRRSHPDIALAAVGVTVPGLVDEAAGVGLFSANLGWRDYPFVARLEARLGLPVAFGHDVGMAGEAEFRIGAARGRSDVVVLVIGTGIAGAVFSDGRRLTGGGLAGELGHAMVPGADGALRILESVGSAGAVARRYTEAGGASVRGAREVLERAGLGDALAAGIWADAVAALAFSVAQCVSILGTETVVLGGGLAEAGDALFVPLDRDVDKLLTFHRRPRLVHAELGQNAGLIGSALKARDLLAAAQGSSRPVRQRQVLP